MQEELGLNLVLLTEYPQTTSVRVIAAEAFAKMASGAASRAHTL